MRYQAELGHGQDAEDAAQAVFVVLWKKASDLRKRDSIAGWLHRVARNVCMDARKAQRIRQQRERQAAQMSGQNEYSDDGWSDIKEYLVHELNRLREKYRLPIILFHLEGRSQEEIAVLLRVSSRP
jgi:RNA polymerase sigma factor (sigma-70 family)